MQQCGVTLLVLIWLLRLLLLSAKKQACLDTKSPGFKPPPGASFPFSCTGHESIDLSDRAGLIDVPFELNQTLQFETCSEITSLSLAGLGMTRIRKGAFAGLSKLKSLCLNNNSKLDSIATEAFSGMVLTDLTLKQNGAWRSIKNGTFRGLVVDNLYLNYNSRLSNIESGAFDQLRVAVGLYLNYKCVS